MDLPEEFEQVSEKLLSTGTTYGRKFTVTELVAAVGALRLCNIDMSQDRGSYRMRYIAAAFVALLQRPQTGLKMTGPLLTHACSFAILTGGLGMCRLLRDALRQDPPQAAWCLDLLRAHDDPMVWNSSRGRPRVQQTLDEDLSVDAEIHDGGGQAVPAEHPEEDAERNGSLFAPMTPEQKSALWAQGLELLRRAETDVTWAVASHNGFRQMKALGHARAAQVWCDYVDKSSLTWRRNFLHRSSFFMPRPRVA